MGHQVRRPPGCSVPGWSNCKNTSEKDQDQAKLQLHSGWETMGISRSQSAHVDEERDVWCPVTPSWIRGGRWRKLRFWMFSGQSEYGEGQGDNGVSPLVHNFNLQRSLNSVWKCSKTWVFQAKKIKCMISSWLWEQLKSPWWSLWLSSKSTLTQNSWWRPCYRVVRLLGQVCLSLETSCAPWLATSCTKAGFEMKPQRQPISCPTIQSTMEILGITCGQR